MSSLTNHEYYVKECLCSKNRIHRAIYEVDYHLPEIAHETNKPVERDGGGGEGLALIQVAKSRLISNRPPAALNPQVLVVSRQDAECVIWMRRIIRATFQR